MDTYIPACNDARECEYERAASSNRYMYLFLEYAYMEESKDAEK